MTIPHDMRAVAIAAPGGPEMLVERRSPVPEPVAGEVLIRVAAAGVNFPDVVQRQGRYDPPAGHSPLPGLEVSGEIAALGPGVTALAPGQRVVALCNGGGYADYVAVPAGQVLPLPETLDFVTGAALPETFFTIQQTLVMRAGLAADMHVLIHGAGGGIGGAAITISRALGARPIAVVSNAEKAGYARSLGATAVIDHSAEDFVARTMELTDGHGADRIVSIAGGDMVSRNMEAAAQRGWIVQLALLGAGQAEVPLWRLLSKDLTVIGSTLRAQPAEVKAAIAASLNQMIWPALAAGSMALPRLQVTPLAAAAKAHAAMEQRDNFGKHVLVTAYGSSVIGDKFVARR